MLQLSASWRGSIAVIKRGSVMLRPYKSSVMGAILLSVALTLLCAGKSLADDFTGCYELKMSPWVPALSLGGDGKFISPPARVVLTTTPEHTWDPRGYKVLAANGVASTVHTFSYWVRETEPDRIRIKWTTGHAGLTMDLRRRGSTLEGTAQSFWDFQRQEQTSHVVATKISCE
jgi:hypothetical protein